MKTIYFTTDKNIFNSCKREKLNVVLQDPMPIVQTMARFQFYYSDTKISYTNIEAEDGHFQQQLRMLQFVTKIIHL